MIYKLRIATLGLTAAALALPLGAFAQEELPTDVNRSIGEIVAVNPAQATFTLANREGEETVFQTGERTRYRGEGIESLDDLEPGLVALVLWVENDAGQPFALAVAAKQLKDRSELKRYAGEITGVVPGQGTFTLATRDGQELEFSTSERTRFRSRDGSVEDIHDLKKGMHALVGAIAQSDGTLMALVVAVGTPQDLPELDLRAVGEVIAIDGGSFTLQTRGGEQLTLAVDGNTKYNGIAGFDQLQVGMVAAVGAVETDSGYLAVWVGARERREDREAGPEPEVRPFRTPENPSEAETSA